MKKLTLVLAIVLAPIAGAAGKVTDINGQAAGEIFQLLEQSGAERVQGIESAFISVKNATVDYTPRGFIYSQFHAFDGQSGKDVSLFTDASFRLYSALSKAGVKVVANDFGLEGGLINAKSISCSSGFMPRVGRYKNCTVQQ